MPSIAICAADTDAARDAEARLRARYPTVEPERADVIVALGGDGFMLQTLHRFMGHGRPVFGMNRGSVGFLLNEYAEDGLPERVEIVAERRPTVRVGECRLHPPGFALVEGVEQIAHQLVTHRCFVRHGSHSCLFGLTTSLSSATIH